MAHVQIKFSKIYKGTSPGATAEISALRCGNYARRPFRGGGEDIAPKT